MLCKLIWTARSVWLSTCHAQGHQACMPLFRLLLPRFATCHLSPNRCEGGSSGHAQVGVLGDVMSSAPNVTSKGRLGPGQMICADYEEVHITILTCAALHAIAHLGQLICYPSHCQSRMWTAKTACIRTQWSAGLVFLAYQYTASLAVG